MVRGKKTTMGRHTHTHIIYIYIYVQDGHFAKHRTLVTNRVIGDLFVQRERGGGERGVRGE